MDCFGKTYLHATEYLNFSGQKPANAQTVSSAVKTCTTKKGESEPIVSISSHRGMLGFSLTVTHRHMVSILGEAAEG